MKKNLIIFFITVMLVIGLSGCFEVATCEGQWINVRFEGDEPLEYKNVSIKEMNQYPKMKQAIEKVNEKIKQGETDRWWNISQLEIGKERREIEEFLNISCFEYAYINYENQYYRIHFEAADC